MVLTGWKGRTGGASRALFGTEASTRWTELAVMAGHDASSQHQFTGIKKYFNSYTLTGRKNCVLATYGAVALIILYFKLRPKKQTPAVKEA